MAKYNIANVLAVMEGLGAAKNANAQRQQEAQQQFQGQALQLVPQLLRAQQQQRQSTLAPYQSAFDAAETPGSKATAFSALQQALQGLGPEPDPGSFLAPVLNWRGKGAIQFPGFAGPQGAMPALAQPEFRDPVAERQTALTEQRGYEEGQDLLRAKRSGVSTTAARYANPAAFNPYLEKGELPAPQPFSARFPIPGARGATVGVQGTPETFVPAGAGELVDEREARQQAERDRKLAGYKSEEQIRKEGFQTKLAQMKLDAAKGDQYARNYIRLHTEGMRQNINPLYLGDWVENQLAGANGQERAPLPGTPEELYGPGGSAAAAGVAAKNAGAAVANARAADIPKAATDRAKRATAYVEKITKDLDPEFVGGQSWYRKSSIAARQATESRKAQAGAGVGPGGAVKWNPGMTARVRAEENQLENAEKTLAKAITTFGKESAERAKANNGKDPSGENWSILDLDRLGEDFAKGKITPTYKKDGKVVTNPTFPRLKRALELYQGVKRKRASLNATLDQLAPTGNAPLTSGLPDATVTVRPAREPATVKATQPGQAVNVAVQQDLARAKKLLKRDLTEAERNSVSRATRAKFAN